MSRWTEQTEGAKLHNAAQARQRQQRDAELLERFERSGMSQRAFAGSIGMSAQRLSIILRRARDARATS